jgi:hypothetical protein
MKLIIAAGELRSHTHVFWGVALIVLGVLHLTFRRFYARRRKAIHDARAETAPAMTGRFYLTHSPAWYLNWEIWGGLAMIVGGVVLVIV